MHEGPKTGLLSNRTMRLVPASHKGLMVEPVEHVRPTIKSKVFLIIQPEAEGSSLIHQLNVGNGTFLGGGVRLLV